jgi:hypothetical protein
MKLLVMQIYTIINKCVILKYEKLYRYYTELTVLQAERSRIRISARKLDSFSVDLIFRAAI